LYYWDYIYSKDNNCIISLDASTKKLNKIPKGYLNAKLFASNEKPIKNAYIRISTTNEFIGFNVNIYALGYYPMQINNVQFLPGLLCTLKVNLDSIQSINQISNQNEVKNLTLSLGIDSPEDTVTYLYGKKFADEVYNLSDGRIKIKVFTNAKMGTDRKMLKTILQDGYPDFIIQTTAPEVDFVPKLAIFDIPMVYNDISNLRKLLDNDKFFKTIDNAYTDSGYKLLGMADILFRQMSSNKIIQNIEDFKDVKIRTIQNRDHEKFWESLGSTIVPLPASEIYTSLKFGFIDAQENPYDVISGFRLYDVQKYIINTYHLPHLLPLITSNEFYNNLSLEEKAIINEAAKRATIYAREKANERFEEKKEFLINKGMAIIELPETTKQAMKLAALSLYERIRRIVGDDELINMYLQNRNSI